MSIVLTCLKQGRLLTNLSITDTRSEDNSWFHSKKPKTCAADVGVMLCNPILHVVLIDAHAAECTDHMMHSDTRITPEAGTRKQTI